MMRKESYRGQSLVEFALIFPLLLFLLLGFLDMGRAIFYYSSLSNAVREATRYAIVNKPVLEEAYLDGTNNSLQDKVLEYAFGLTQTPTPLTRDAILVEVIKETNRFTTVTVSAVYEFDPVTPGIQRIVGSGTGIPLEVRSTMYVTPGAR